MLCCSVVNDVHSVSHGGLTCLSQHRHYWQKKIPLCRNQRSLTECFALDVYIFIVTIQV